MFDLVGYFLSVVCVLMETDVYFSVVFIFIIPQAEHGKL